MVGLGALALSLSLGQIQIAIHFHLIFRAGIDPGANSENAIFIPDPQVFGVAG